jgi:hypothetical protein
MQKVVGRRPGAIKFAFTVRETSRSRRPFLEELSGAVLHSIESAADSVRRASLEWVAGIMSMSLVVLPFESDVARYSASSATRTRTRPTVSPNQ